jgi:hypothetical protein
MQVRHLWGMLCVVPIVVAFAFVGSVIAEEPGFVAEVTGDRSARISGPGVFFCIRHYEAGGLSRPSYLVVGDASGVRPNGLTFTIPRSRAPGEFSLQDHDPFAVGSRFEARAELGSSTVYFDKQVDGTIAIESLPDGVASAPRTRIRGRFDFEISNSKGERVRVKGHFDFAPPPSDQESAYCE